MVQFANNIEWLRYINMHNVYIPNKRYTINGEEFGYNMYGEKGYK